MQRNKVVTKNNIIQNNKKIDRKYICRKYQIKQKLIESIFARNIKKNKKNDRKHIGKIGKEVKSWNIQKVMYMS